MRRIIPVPSILGSTRHTIVIDFHAVSVGRTVPTGITNVFSINPLGRPIRWSVWHTSSLKVVNIYGRLLELLGQVIHGYGEVCYGFFLGHHRVPVCRHLWCQVNEGIVGFLLSFSEVVNTVVSCWPGVNIFLPLVFTLCRLKVCLEVCPGFVGACLIVLIVTVIVK